MNTLTQTKLKASSIHLFASIIMLAILTTFIYLAWYPQPYFMAAGGMHGIKLLTAIVLALGPGITLIAFNPEKSRKAVLFDTSFIIVIQLAAILWGTYAVYSQRPLVVAYSNGIFQAVTADAFEQQEKNTLTFADLSKQRPPLVYSREPETADEKKGVVLFGFVGGVSKHELAFLYEPLTENMNELFEVRTAKLNMLRSNPSLSAKLDKLLINLNMNTDEIVTIQFVGRNGKAWMILSNSGELLDVI